MVQSRLKSAQDASRRHGERAFVLISWAVTLFSFVFLLLRDDTREQILISRFRNQKSVQVHVDKMMPSGMRHNAPDARGGAIVGGNQRHTLACYLIDSIRHCDGLG